MPGAAEGGTKRYRTWNRHLRERFGHKVFKIAFNAGFTCPNRDGSVASGGCTFCSAAGSGDFAGYRRDELRRQYERVRARMHKKWPEGKYIGYFQAYTNTYAPLEELREKYEAVLAMPDMLGLSIATRPDCLPDDVIDYLAELNERVYIWVELGLQTIHEETARLTNRAHGYDCFVEGVAKLRRRNIRVCAHIINGLPGESHPMMMETARAVAGLGIQGIKIHLLHPMAQQYEDGLIRLLDRDEYVSTVCDQLEILPAETIIHRLTGDSPRDLFIGPEWSLNKWETLNAIDAELLRRQTFQGAQAGKTQPITRPDSR
jgi:radical SAM protein (TIGR01212 family)